MLVDMQGQGIKETGYVEGRREKAGSEIFDINLWN